MEKNDIQQKHLKIGRVLETASRMADFWRAILMESVDQ